MRVLIADDSAVMRMILERGLRRAGLAGAEIHQASDGLEALATIEEQAALGHSFDLILTDVHMPVMDGPEFLRELRARGVARGVPVVMITAEDAGDAGWELPCVGRLTKPFTMEQMQASLGPLLQVAAHG
jgi:two-component system chemotaxis response regulator CheY